MSAHETPDPRPDLSLAPLRPLRRRQMFGFLAGMSAFAPMAAWWLGRRREAPALCEETKEPPPAPPPKVVGQGRPRLIIVIPAEPERQYQLGRAFGEYLNHGEDALLAPLALAHLECAAAEELELPTEVHGSGPFALLLLGSQHARLVRFSLPGPIAPRAHDDEDANREIDERIETVAAAVREAVLPEQRVTDLWPNAATEPRARAVADRLRQGEMVSTSEIEHFAPGILASALEAQPEPRRLQLAALAGIVRKRLVEGTVYGSEWARSTGCGTRIEGREQRVAIGCGMGHVPERSQRFLHFYTADGPDW